MKICPKCSKEKDEDCFHKHKGREDGLQSICKECKKNNNRHRYVKNREEILKGNRDYSRTEKGKRSHCDGQYKQRKKYPEKQIARNATRRLTKQPCEVCGETEVEAHHEDYSKPLNVRWLCRQHHIDIHRSKR